MAAAVTVSSPLQVVTFSYVEDFWAVYNHIELASRLAASCDYSVFKNGVKPMWEDSHNSSGGRWVINLDKKLRLSTLDNIWIEVLMSMIGESFGEDGTIVNGAVVSIRNRGDKIGGNCIHSELTIVPIFTLPFILFAAIWLGNAKLASSVMHVGKELKSRLGFGNDIMLSFEAHEDTMMKSGSTAKSRYTV